jgi:hypothetical protein
VHLGAFKTQGKLSFRVRLPLGTMLRGSADRLTPTYFVSFVCFVRRHSACDLRCATRQ